MIHTFRNDMKKWRNILWIVLASLVVSFFSSLFFSRQPTTKATKIGYVAPSGGNIYLYEFLYQLQMVQAQRKFYEQFAKNNSFFAHLPIFSQKPSDLSLQALHENKVIDAVGYDLDIVFDQNIFYTKLAKELPEFMFDNQGRLKEREYKMAINQHYGVEVADFETLKLQEQKRAVVKDAVELASQVTSNDVRSAYLQEYGKKRFAILSLTQEPFADGVRAQGVTDNQLRDFYANHAEAYRQPEQRQFDYWTISADAFKKGIVVSDEKIERYYHKNENELFRIPPKVKVRHIRVENEDQARKLHEQLVKDQTIFAALAKKYSTAQVSAKKGGLIDFFKSGTFDRAFETASFALTKEKPLSQVIKTADGYEVILLIDRKNASSKPLSMVKDDIVDTIKQRGALEKLSSAVKKLSHDARDDESAIDMFIAKHNLALKNTGWIDEKEGETLSVSGLIAKRAFAYNGRYGITPQQDRQIIFREKDRMPSKIPSFDVLKEQIEKDYVNDRAQKALKSAIKEAKHDILSGSKSLEDLAAQHQVAVITTDLIQKSDGLKSIPGGSLLLERAFLLTSKDGQVAKKRFDGGYHLAQLREDAPIDESEFDSVSSDLRQKEKERLKRYYYPAFVASLQRHATLKTNDNFREILNSIKHIDER